MYLKNHELTLCNKWLIIALSQQSWNLHYLFKIYASIWTIFPQYLLNIWTIFEQYLHKICKIFVKSLHNSCTISQHFHNIWVRLSPLQPFSQICACVFLNLFFFYIRREKYFPVKKKEEEKSKKYSSHPFLRGFLYF